MGKHLFILVTQKQIESKMKRIKKLKSDGKIKQDQSYSILSFKINKIDLSIVVDYDTERTIIIN